MAETVIRIVGGASFETELAGQYVRSYSPHGHGGRGFLETTPHAWRAKRYTSLIDAHADWSAVSDTHPTRLDGKPNRPMTAFTVAYEPAPPLKGAAA